MFADEYAVAGERVAEVMKADRRHAGLACHRLQQSMAQRIELNAAENEIIGSKSTFVVQERHDWQGNRDNAIDFAFGPRIQSFRLRTPILIYRHQTLVKIDPAALQSLHFSGTEPCVPPPVNS